MKLFMPLIIFLFTACKQPAEQEVIQAADTTTTNATSIIVVAEPEQPKEQQVNYITGTEINTGTTLPLELVNYAKTLIGVPYLK